MSDSDVSASGINFDAPATFRKWPSLKGQRRVESAGPYLLLDGTLDQCIQLLLAKPPAVRQMGQSEQKRTARRTVRNRLVIRH
jgi:hypothetical protein